MEIVIGSAIPVKPAKSSINRKTAGPQIEARVLDSRSARKYYNAALHNQEDRRKKGGWADPAKSRVLVLMVADGGHVPDDIMTGNYKVVLKFVPQNG